MITYRERGRFRGGDIENHLRVKKRMEPECAHNYFILGCLGAIKSTCQLKRLLLSHVKMCLWIKQEKTKGREVDSVRAVRTLA